MMDFNERVIPGITANYLLQESLSRYVFASNFINNNSSILDLGCGTGYGSRVLSKKGTVTGVDKNSEAIKFARKNYSNYGNFVTGNVENLNFIDNSFDFICSFEVIEHLNNTDKYLNEVSRVLKKGGYFILSTPNVLYRKYKEESSSPYHKHEFNPEELKRKLTGQFSSIKIYGQSKSLKAGAAFRDFLKSQRKRQLFVDSDKFKLRKLLPRWIKESVWRKISLLFGAEKQELLQTSDFVFSKNPDSAEYLIVLCKKK